MMKLSRLYKIWRESWEYDRLKHDLGPVDDEAWHDHVNEYTVAQVIERLIDCEDYIDD